MKNSKRIISALLSIIIVFSMFTIIPFTAGAEGEQSESTGNVTVKALYKSQKIEWEDEGTNLDKANYTVSYTNGNGDNETISSDKIKKYEYNGKTYFYLLDETSELRTYTVTKNSADTDNNESTTTIGSAPATKSPGLDQLVQNAAYSSLTDTEFNNINNSVGRTFSSSGGAYIITSSSESDSNKAKLYQKLKSLTEGSVMMSYTNSSNITALQRLFEATTDATGGNDNNTHFFFGPKGTDLLQTAAGSTSGLISSVGHTINDVGAANANNNLVVTARNLGTNKGTFIASANGSDAKGWVNFPTAQGHFLEDGISYAIGKTYTSGTIHYVIISEECYDSNPTDTTVIHTEIKKLSSCTVENVKEANLKITEFSAKALYKSHKLEWQSNCQDNFRIFKTNSSDNTETDVTSQASITPQVVNGKVYYTALIPVDIGTGQGTNYILKTNYESKQLSAAVEEETGFEALKKNAVVAVNYGKDGKYFDGVTEAEDVLATFYSDSKDVVLKKLKTLSNSSIILAFSAENVSGILNQEILGFGSGTGRSIGINYTNFGNKIRVSPPAFDLSSQKIITNEKPYSVGVSCGTSKWYFGESTDYDGLDVSASYALLNNTVTGITLGGGTVSTNHNKFKGVVYYLIISEEVYDKDELNTITKSVNQNDNDIFSNYTEKNNAINEFEEAKAAVQADLHKEYKTTVVENPANAEALQTIKNIIPNGIGDLNLTVLNSTLAEITDKTEKLTALKSAYDNITEKTLCEEISETCSNLQKITDYDQLANNASASTYRNNGSEVHQPANAFKEDGTLWIQEYSGTPQPSAANPQWIQTDLGAVKSIAALGYVARAEHQNVIGDYEIWVSNDPNFAPGNYAVAKTGTFADTAAEQKIVFETPYDARYIRLVAKGLVSTNTQNYTCAGAKNIYIYEYVGASENVKIQITANNGEETIDVATEIVDDAVQHKFAEITDADLQKAYLDGKFNDVLDKYNSLKYDYTVRTIEKDEETNEYIVSVEQENALYTLSATYSGETYTQEKHYKETFEDIEAPETDSSGQHFSYWALEGEGDADGAKIGDSRFFNYQATADMNITAVYAETPNEEIGAYIPEPIQSIQKVDTTLYNTLEIPVSFFNVQNENSTLKENVSEFGVVIVPHNASSTAEQIKEYLQGTGSITAQKSVAYNGNDKNTQLTNKGRYLATLYFTRRPAIDIYAYVIVDGTAYLSNMQIIDQKDSPNAVEQTPAE